MPDDHQDQLDEIYAAALKLDPAQRTAFVRQACSTNGLREEIESLLDDAERLGSFLEKPAIDALSMTGRSLMGVMLGPYKVEALLGAGGMGMVYRARDTRLGRAVAIKQASGEFSGRFLAEARAVAALNHPHVCTLYDIGPNYLVMELLEGQTLDRRLRIGPLPVDQIVRSGIEIVNALAAAHARGIIHRDLKPGNIMMTAAGVKVLDFGLAKLMPLAAAAVAGMDAPTASIQQAPRTDPGTVVGTVAYMSPEQARGEELDGRSDLFTLGIVLYEMATGKRPFEGSSNAVTFEAILNRPVPPARELNPKVPERLDEIIHKALEKDRALRYQHASDLLADLKRLERDSASTQQALAPRKTRRLWIAIAATAVLLALAGFWIWSQRERFSPPPRIAREQQLTRNVPENRHLGFDISPDGQRLLYVDMLGLHLRRIDTGETHDVPLPQELRARLWNVMYFPDGERILLLTGDSAEPAQLWTTSIFGEPPRKIRAHVRQAAISPDGASIAFLNFECNEIWVMGPNGENAKKILSSENDRFYSPVWSPDSRRLAYIKAKPNYLRFEEGLGGSIETVDLERGAREGVLSAPNLLAARESARLAWLADGRVLFNLRDDMAPGGSYSSWNLWGVGINPRTGKASGKPQKITNWSGVLPWQPRASRNGTRLAVNKGRFRNNIYLAELRGNSVRLDTPSQFTASDSLDRPYSWTIDSQSLIFSSDRTGTKLLYKQHLGRTSAEMLTPPENLSDRCAATPDGNWILYHSIVTTGKAGPSSIRWMRMPVAGGPPERVLDFSAGPEWDWDCSRSSRGICVVGRLEKEHAIFYPLDPLHGLGKALASTEWPAGAGFSLAVSPDGSLISIRSDRQIRFLDWRKGTERTIQIPAGWWIFQFEFSADGKAVICAAQAVSFFLARIELDGSTHILLDRGRSQSLAPALPSPDGRYLAFGQLTFESNVWLLENF